VKKIKKITLTILTIVVFAFDTNAAIKDSIFATVGNKAITRSDVINELKIILILNGQSFQEEYKAQIEAAAMNSVIKRSIKQIEIEKHNLDFNPIDLEKELEKMAMNVNMDLDTLKKTFQASDVDFSLVEKQIKTELMWNSLIFKLYKNRLFINKDEVDDKIKLFQNKKEIKEYLISELVIKPVPKEELNEKIKKIKDRIELEGFEKVAMDLSISETGVKGGNLGWIREDIISNEFKSKIIKTPIGEISEPLLMTEGILLFKIRDSRNIKQITDLEDIKKNIIESEKTKILRMHSLSHYDRLRRSISVKYF
tara:strand:- start:268 stop:1200 length:933 start_codon:yes stop_codon:yes gene_type:complete